MVKGRTIRTPKKGEKLLAKLSQGFSIAAACKAEGIGRQSYYDWRSADPEFAVAADIAIEEGTDLLEDAARRRAVSPLGSDTLLIFLLKARRPEKYKDRLVNEHTGKDGEPLAIKVIYADDRTDAS